MVWYTDEMLSLNTVVHTWLLLATSVSGLPYNNDDGPDTDMTGYGDEWLLFYDENGNTHTMNFSAFPQDTRTMILGDAYYDLYTRRNPEGERLQIPSGDEPVESRYFNSSNAIKVITHGWLSSGRTEWLLNMKDTFLSHLDCNVIAVDWSELAENPVYPWSACSTRYVGKKTARLLNALAKTYQIDGRGIHLIGHSLGSHVMGYTGSFSNQRIYRITEGGETGPNLGRPTRDLRVDRYIPVTRRFGYIHGQYLCNGYFLYYGNSERACSPPDGLDPARPLFELPLMPPQYRLEKSDAEYVDIIHTAAGVLGYKNSHGHADFYPNNGKPKQPGCDEGLRQVIEACSHGRAIEFFSESIVSRIGFLAYPCDNWAMFNEGECKDNSTHMGYPSTSNTRGNHYLHTNEAPEYARGNEFS